MAGENNKQKTKKNKTTSNRKSVKRFKQKKGHEYIVHDLNMVYITVETSFVFLVTYYPFFFPCKILFAVVIYYYLLNLIKSFLKK